MTTSNVAVFNDEYSINIMAKEEQPITTNIIAFRYIHFGLIKSMYFSNRIYWTTFILCPARPGQIGHQTLEPTSMGHSTSLSKVIAVTAAMIRKSSPCKSILDFVQAWDIRRVPYNIKMYVHLLPANTHNASYARFIFGQDPESPIFRKGPFADQFMKFIFSGFIVMFFGSLQPRGLGRGILRKMCRNKVLVLVLASSLVPYITSARQLSASRLLPVFYMLDTLRSPRIFADYSFRSCFVRSKSVFLYPVGNIVDDDFLNIACLLILGASALAVHVHEQMIQRRITLQYHIGTCR